MKKSLILLFAIAIFVTAVPAQKTIMLNKSAEKNSVTFVSEDYSDAENPTMTLRAQLRFANYEVVETPKGTFVRMLFPGVGAYNFNPRSPGEPQRPVFNTFIEAPLEASVRVEVESMVVEEYSAEELGIEYPVMPNQPSVSRQQKEFEFSFNEASYNRGYAKNGVVSAREIGILRSYRLFMLQIKACDYNPRDGKIKFFTDVQVKVTFKDPDLDKTKAFKKKFSTPPVDNVCASIIHSPTLSSFAAERKGALKYLIVADPMFKNTLQPFIDFKNSKQITTVVKYTDVIGTNKDDIRDAIAAEYNNPPDGVPPTFLLLVGDREELPTFDGTEGFYVTDLYYAAVGGSDFLPDMLHGRFSARNTQDLQNQIEKTIAYESGNLPDYQFLKNSLLVAGYDSYWGVKRGYPHVRYAEKYYLTSGNGHQNVAMFLSSASQQNVAQIRQKVSQGIGIYNYTAHGVEESFHDPSFTKQDINNLTNNNMYPLVVGNCCLTNSFEVDECFGEAWLRAKDKGAIGFIGGTSYTYWDEDYWWGVGQSAFNSSIEQGNPPVKADTGPGSYDSVFKKDHFFTNAGMMLAGNLAVQQADSYLTKYYFEVYHLMGDPGLPAFWATPSNPPSSK